MIKGFVLSITFNEDQMEAVIMLENKSTYIVSIEMLPANIEIDDFVIIDNGVIKIDPNCDDFKDLLQNTLEDLINKNSE